VSIVLALVESGRREAELATGHMRGVRLILCGPSHSDQEKP
jgi:hypothetical protein